MMIQKRDEVGDRPLEVNIVLPERVVGVDQEVLAGGDLRPLHGAPFTAPERFQNHSLIVVKLQNRGPPRPNADWYEGLHRLQSTLILLLSRPLLHQARRWRRDGDIHLLH